MPHAHRLVSVIKTYSVGEIALRDSTDLIVMPGSGRRA